VVPVEPTMILSLRLVETLLTGMLEYCWSTTWSDCCYYYCWWRKGETFCA